MYINSHKFYKLLTLIFITLFLSSCSISKGEKVIDKQESEPEVVEEQIATVEIEDREPIFVYDNKQQPEGDLEEVYLKIGDQPLLLPLGYVRLVGVVSGRSPLALIEVGGRGIYIAVGDAIAGYYVNNISGFNISLIRKEKD